MRKNEFRGISRETNLFVYGMLMYSVSDSGLIIVETVNAPPTMQDPCGDTINVYHGIIQGSEGQYIDLEDLNNKEAYEDDLIRYKYYHENGEKVIGIAKIYFDGGCYFLEDVKTKYKYPMYLVSLSFEIIGNIHENKDLLK